MSSQAYINHTVFLSQAYFFWPSVSTYCAALPQSQGEKEDCKNARHLSQNAPFKAKAFKKGVMQIANK